MLGKDIRPKTDKSIGNIEKKKSTKNTLKNNVYKKKALKFF